MIESLTLKENIREARARWDAFWQGEMPDRPIVCVTAPRQDAPCGEPYEDNYYTRLHSDLRAHARGVLGNMSRRLYLGEAIPSAFLSFGCDEIAAFCGGSLCFSEGSRDTNWSKPFVEDWDEALPFRIDDSNPLWRRMLEYIGVSADCYRGKMTIDPIDLHTNMDLLLAVRGAKRLCMDLMDRPEAIDRAMVSAQSIFDKVWYETRRAGELPDRSGATLQCDFSCMISPAMFRRWALPALEREADRVGNVTYHWDGVDALIHADDIIASRGLYRMAFVPGAGQGSHADFIELYQKVQSGGKAVAVNGPPDMMKWIHRQLDPRLTTYSTHVNSRGEAEKLLKWFADNT